MNRLKLLREEKGLYLIDIAKILGVSATAVSYYENEKRDMTPDTILKLADYFGVSTDYLLGKTDIRNSESIKLSDIDIAFASGVKGLNDTNKQIAKQLVEGLLAKQKEEENNKKRK